jgi:hypothetical protein
MHVLVEVKQSAVELDRGVNVIDDVADAHAGHQNAPRTLAESFLPHLASSGALPPSRDSNTESGGGPGCCFGRKAVARSSLLLRMETSSPF